MSLAPALVSAVEPNSPEPAKLPTTVGLPCASTPSPVATSALLPPICFDHPGPPSVVYLATKPSELPALVSGPLPKSATPENCPATRTLPLPSTRIALLRSVLVPPSPLAHTGAPVAVYLATTTSSLY